MTNAEAIKMLKSKMDGHTDTSYEWAETVRMAIKALEQEPCEDCISRKTVNTLIDELARAISDERCCISRGRDTATIMQEILDLPSVKPKTGHWEWVQYDYNPKLGDWHCSECRSVVVECVSKEEKGGIPLYKYCPQCGAKMESEDKE